MENGIENTVVDGAALLGPVTKRPSSPSLRGEAAAVQANRTEAKPPKVHQTKEPEESQARTEKRVLFVNKKNQKNFINFATLPYYDGLRLRWPPETGQVAKVDPIGWTGIGLT